MGTWVCVQACVHMRECVRAHVHVGPRLMLGIFLDFSLPDILRQDFSLNPEAPPSAPLLSAHSGIPSLCLSCDCHAQPALTWVLGTRTPVFTLARPALPHEPLPRLCPSL